MEQQPIVEITMTIAHQTQSYKLAIQHQTKLQKMREVERAKEFEHAKKLLKITSFKHVLDSIDAM